MEIMYPSSIAMPTRGVKRPQRVPTDCLVVRNLPPEKNTVTELSNHFQQFGTIINIRVRHLGPGQLHCLLHRAHTYAYTHTYVHTHMHTHMYMHACIRIYTHTYTHMYTPHACICTYTHTYAHMYTHTRIHTCTHTHLHACMHTYIHAHIHTHVHTHTYMQEHAHMRWMFFLEMEQLMNERALLLCLSLQVRFNNDQQSALVQFSSVAEAQKAFESSDAVCGNRFVKVFYFKVHEGGPGRRRGREEILEVTVSRVGGEQQGCACISILRSCCCCVTVFVSLFHNCYNSLLLFLANTFKFGFPGSDVAMLTLPLPCPSPPPPTDWCAVG